MKDIYHICNHCKKELSWYDSEKCKYETVSEKYWILLNEDTDEFDKICLDYTNKNIFKSFILTLFVTFFGACYSSKNENN